MRVCFYGFLPARAGALAFMVLFEDTELVVRNWRPGDSVVVGASSDELEDSEMARVLAVEGKELVLQEGLRARHEGAFGEARLNAPVGLLTRNLRISGDSELWAGCQKAYSSVVMDALALQRVRRACFGGHLLFVQNSRIHIEHSEFSLLGQALEMARYPVHWHLAGNAYGHYIRNSSLHHNFQRCVTIHGSEGVQVQSNVCFQTFGHAFYLEDGIETGNSFDRNLIISVHQGGSVCSDWIFGKGPRTNLQLGPSGFWITNPNNSFSENHVIGVGTGYWFTFPDGCGLAALPTLELCRRRNPVTAMGLSARYFNDTRSGHGFGSWWLRQEPSRTRVPVFRRNAVGTASRGVHVDGRVMNSADEHVPCWSDACSSCSGPLEGSSSWVPMRFDPSLPLAQRSYRFQANRFEDFLAAHISGGPAPSESRAVWTSGGYIHFTGAVFWNCRHIAASMPELTTACFKVTEASPPGFTLVFERSLFISGDLSETFFQLYDAGIHIKNSRWLLTASSSPSFRVAKPKCAFGGNGNPIYFEGSRELRQNLTKDRDFAWAVQALGTGIRMTATSQIVSFDCIAWESPYIEGSYVYSPDSFGLETGAPTILAPDRERRTSRRVLGRSACAAYLKATKPRFFCGKSFGTYGLWCGSGIPVEECPGAADATNWYHSMLPWSRGERSEDSEDVLGSGTTAQPVWARPPPSGDCDFPNPGPPKRTPFTWDPSCLRGGLGCNADGSHMECRWCGFDPYLPCPETQESAIGATGDSDLFVGLIALLLSALFLSLLAALCWYTSRRRARARPSCISQIRPPRQEAPSLLGRTTLPAEKPIRDLPLQ